MNIKKLLLAALTASSIFFNMEAKKSYIFYADGVEEVEAVATVDALRRAGMEVVTVSVTGTPTVTGATGQKLVADSTLNEINPANAEWLIVPGGVPGAPNLHGNARVNEIIKTHWADGGKIASICAGPAVVLAPTGVLKGKKATCYPGLEKALTDAGATYLHQPVVVDGRLITSEGPGTTLSFARAIIEATKGADAAHTTMTGMLAAH